MLNVILYRMRLYPYPVTTSLRANRIVHTFFGGGGKNEYKFLLNLGQNDVSCNMYCRHANNPQFVFKSYVS